MKQLLHCCAALALLLVAARSLAAEQSPAVPAATPPPEAASSDEDGESGEEATGAAIPALDEGDLDDEVSPSTAELRDQVLYGACLGLGVTTPWQSASLDLQYFLTPQLSLSWSTGAGRAELSHTDSGKSYSLELSSLASNVGVHWFFTERLPVFFQAVVGLVSWEGDVERTGGAAAATALLAEDLESTFKASGLLTGLSFGLGKLWANGVYLEYSIFGVMKSFPFNVDVSGEDEGNANATQDAVERELARPMSWGIFNIKVGYFF